MAAPKTAQDILVTELKEIHSAERQLSRAVPKLSRKISNETLKQMLDQRREQGAGVIEELDAIFEEMEVTKARPKNVAAEGLIEDMNEHLEEIDDPKLLDPVLVGAIQKLQHYCIAAWGTTASLGRLLDQQRAVKLMERLLEEGKRMDQELTELAESEINPLMLEEDDEEDSEEIEASGKGKSKGTSGGKGKK
jgi:ferritin-like metal-binding protein YciE